MGASVQSKYIQDPHSSLKALEYGYCSGSPQVFDLTADITPMPISLATGSIVTVLMSFDLKDTMPEGTMLEVDVKKDGWLIDKMPAGQGCSLPLAPGLYGGPPALEMTVPEIDPILADLAKGKIRAELKFVSGGSTFACVWMSMDIA